LVGGIQKKQPTVKDGNALRVFKKLKSLQNSDFDLLLVKS